MTLGEQLREGDRALCKQARRAAEDTRHATEAAERYIATGHYRLAMAFASAAEEGSKSLHSLCSELLEGQG